MSDSFSYSFSLPANHACFQGHFPTQPIVPGVMLLSILTQFLYQEKIRLLGFKQVKFLAPLLPHQSCQLNIESLAHQQWRFAFLYQDNTIATGILQGEYCA